MREEWKEEEAEYKSKEVNEWMDGDIKRQDEKQSSRISK